METAKQAVDRFKTEAVETAEQAVDRFKEEAVTTLAMFLAGYQRANQRFRADVARAGQTLDEELRVLTTSQASEPAHKRFHRALDDAHVNRLRALEELRGWHKARLLDLQRSLGVGMGYVSKALSDIALAVVAPEVYGSEDSDFR